MNLEPGSTIGSGLAPVVALRAGQANASIAFSHAWVRRSSAMNRIGRKLIYVMLVIVVLLIIWQFLGSL